MSVVEATTQGGQGIFSNCSGFWDCSYSAVLVLTSAVSIYMFATAFVILRRASNDKKLDRIDYILFLLAFAQVVLVLITKILSDSNFFTFTIRTLALIQNIVVCSICSYNYFNEEDSPMIQRYTLMAVGLSIALWFFSLIDDKSILQFSICQRMNNLLYSSLNLIVSLLVLWITYQSAKTINKWVRDEYPKAEGPEAEIKYEEMQRIKNQLLILMLSMLGSSLAHLIWDFHKFEYGTSKESCISLFHAQGFGSFFLFGLHDLIGFLVPPWAIYYIFYWRNRNSF